MQENEIQKKHLRIWERQKQNLWTVNLSFRKREARLPEDIQQINSVALSTEYNLYPTKLISTVTETPERNSDLNKSDLSPLLGECEALLLFLCYDIHDAVGVTNWLVRH